MNRKLSVLERYSDINEVKRRAHNLGLNEVHPSSQAKKKYMIFDGQKMIHFGGAMYEDYTKHQDNERRKRYIGRATKIKGDWKKDKYSPNNLSINLLWNNSKAIR
jgi:hypothetical protein